MSADRRRPDGDRADPLREAAIEVVRALREHGHEALFAGGCVRDRLMGNEPGDYDVATSARPREVRAIFPRARFVGEAFGVVLVHRRGFVIEVATFRVDGDYGDGRHPDEVTFSDAAHDARRRDFTINGLFEDPIAERVIDLVGGIDDIEQRIVRAIGDPASRFREDHLRMLRAVRFAARFESTIEPLTADAIRAMAGNLAGVSRERIGEEVRRMMAHPNRGVAAWEIQYLNLDATVLGEDHVLSAPTRTSRLPDHAPPAVALAAWMLDRLGLGTGGPDLPEDALLERAARWREALVLSNAEHDLLERCLVIHEALRIDWPRLRVARQKRLAADAAFPHALSILAGWDRAAFVDVRRRAASLEATGLAPEPLIDGSDLIRLGIRPGPLVGRVLREVYDAQLEGRVTDHDDARRYAIAMVEADAGGPDDLGG